MEHCAPLSSQSGAFSAPGRDEHSEILPSMMAFGRYVAFPAARTLLCGGIPVCLGGRAFDLLVLLLASRGTLVSKQAIMRHVWPSTIVDESNLRFQMAALRKALGSDRDLIKTIPGRGYLLATEVDMREPEVLARSPDPLRSDDPEGQRVICDALYALLVALERHSTAAASVEAMLSVPLSKMMRPERPSEAQRAA